MSASSLASWAAFRVGKPPRWIDFETPDWKTSLKRKLYLIRDVIKLMLLPGRQDTTLPKKKVSFTDGFSMLFPLGMGNLLSQTVPDAKNRIQGVA